MAFVAQMVKLDERNRLCRYLSQENVRLEQLIDQATV